MNMPNLASCHQAILCARVAASLLWAGEVDAVAAGGPTILKACKLRDEYAAAPATPRCFRNSRRDAASVSMRFFLRLRNRRSTEYSEEWAGASVSPVAPPDENFSTRNGGPLSGVSGPRIGLFRHVDVDVLLNEVLGSVCVPSLDGKNVGSVGSIGNFLLQVWAFGGCDHGLVNRRPHLSNGFWIVHDLHVDVKSVADVGFGLRRHNVD